MNNRPLALRILIVLVMLVIAFHFTIVAQILPYEIVWAGKLKTSQEMYVWEAVSLFINLILLLSLLLKGKYIRNNIPPLAINIVLSAFIVLFLLNTVGNLMAQTMIERMVFTPLTLLFAILLLTIVTKNKKGQPASKQAGH